MSPNSCVATVQELFAVGPERHSGSLGISFAFRIISLCKYTRPCHNNGIKSQKEFLCPHFACMAVCRRYAGDGGYSLGPRSIWISALASTALQLPTSGHRRETSCKQCRESATSILVEHVPGRIWFREDGNGPPSACQPAENQHSGQKYSSVWHLQNQDQRRKSGGQPDFSGLSKWRCLGITPRR
jgi:hypothetical protein